MLLDGLTTFLNTFQDSYSLDDKCKYVEMLQGIANREVKILRIDLDDLLETDREQVERSNIKFKSSMLVL